MKITHIATAAAVPAAIAGAIALTATSQAAPRHPAAAGTQHTADARTQSTAAQSASVGQPAPARRPARVWVTVRAGQTLSGIATARHMSWQAIYATPPNTRVLHDPDVLTVGERLRIPADPKLRAAQFERKYATRLRHEAVASHPAAATPAQHSAVGGAALTAGGSSFEQCVAWRESSDTPTDPDGLFGILPSTWQSLGYSGTAGEASVAVQKEAFARLYAEDGTAPWAPYDGC